MSEANSDIDKLCKEDFNLLIEAGFVAVKQLDETSATRLFNAAQALSPESQAPKIGLGYIALNKLEVKEAAKIFEEVIKADEENDLARVFLGISYLLFKPKRDKGAQIIDEVLKKTDDPTIKNLAKVSLEWAEKDLKKGRMRLRYDDGTKEASDKEKEASEEREGDTTAKAEETKASKE